MVLRIYSYYVKYNSIIVADVLKACILAIFEKGKRFVFFPTALQRVAQVSVVAGHVEKAMAG